MPRRKRTRRENEMAEPTIVCPSCKTEIKLTESLAAPLLEATRRDFEQRIKQKDVDLAAKLKDEGAKIAIEEARKAKLALASELDQRTRAVVELENALKENNAKLAEAQKAQADLLRKQRELDTKLREADLTVEKRVQEGLTATRDQARKETEEQMRLKVMEKEQTITAMQRQIEDLKRRAEQGSQQLQGEVQELELEALLRAKFPLDIIDPVPKGEHGGDALQRVVGPLGQVCGTILWEYKRTKGWSDGWLPKLRDDQRAAKAEVAVIVSQVLPKGVETFESIDGVWVTHPRVALPLAVSLRYALIDIASARSASEGQQTKTEMVYQYLTGPRFRQPHRRSLRARHQCRAARCILRIVALQICCNALRRGKCASVSLSEQVVRWLMGDRRFRKSPGLPNKSRHT